MLIGHIGHMGRRLLTQIKYHTTNEKYLEKKSCIVKVYSKTGQAD
jgi:hypothetical protein